ncbi:phosphoribosylformylglycinamidine synthase subunit PurL [Brachybacterium saurashtrense]|uniref:Phosphoribosylformylglycinamidine synthase subunit PurL n=1 Tax=Brachybacterium saurashtrense TaxID=556288 RepID=A0A345YPC0_9MICO|nr:phosphoribosylformylglycinamidine synthase subunit PurL [Brachybacterium saurashtrense]AXK45772.1 phosphoribosylformylglycinamidine synthase subunit PurL [Brachybacterium saurashtrense]RRR24790.1 phosphoribosylformylglycinamidine synthase subunit PurL [Brachybacterium saurashtrense]
MTAENVSSSPRGRSADVDTVEHAAATPEQAQPFAELGLKEDEYASIRELLGRRPTNAELAMYSVMWSEHCSYKSSKKHLRTFGKHTTDAMREKLLVGMGENAGVVDIGDGWAVTFKVESHNHPSYVEPYQGAATGVGGIVRDIISMGARPVAVMDQLRFGAIDHPDTARVVHGVVSGVGGYGNSLGLPNLGGETVFDAAYQSNPLVNALALGVMRHEDIHLASATGAGNKVVLFGARTGGDGIGGASILASETFEEDGPVKRPSVQVGDPFMEKVLIECCLELFAAGTVEGIQDLGAAGISCATSELAANGGSGMHIHLEEVLLRDPSLNAGEILMSESQERMMAVVSPEKLAEFQAIAAKWDVEAAVIGEVTGDGRLTIDHHGVRIVDVDPATVAVDSPVYDRPYARPDWQDALQADAAEALPRPAGAEEIAAQLRTLIASPTLASKGWITDQYDRYVGGNTALAMPDDAGVLRIDEATGRGIALATDANGLYTKLDPRTGAQLALAEAYRNVATAGATPLAITDCLNFGSPEDPGPMWQLVEAIGGLAEACETLEVPVTGGNVSLYNSTGEPGRIDSAIHPTPVVGVLGVFEDVSRRVPSGWQDEGQAVLLLGATAEELSGSAWADVIHQHLGGLPPRVDLEKERALATVLIASSQQGLASAAHDLSEGGLAQALVESTTRFGVGAHVDLAALRERDGVDLASALFSESQARALVAVPAAQEEALTALAAEHGVPVLRLGTTGGEALTLAGVGEFAVSELRELREGTLPRYFG